jgi:hypothetical protein
MTQFVEETTDSKLETQNIKDKSGAPYPESSEVLNTHTHTHTHKHIDFWGRGAVLGFELIASHLRDRRCITGATMSAHFWVGYF